MLLHVPWHVMACATACRCRCHSPCHAVTCAMPHTLRHVMADASACAWHRGFGIAAHSFLVSRPSGFFQVQDLVDGLRRESINIDRVESGGPISTSFQFAVWRGIPLVQSLSANDFKPPLLLICRAVDPPGPWSTMIDHGWSTLLTMVDKGPPLSSMVVHYRPLSE